MTLIIKKQTLLIATLTCLAYISITFPMNDNQDAEAEYLLHHINLLNEKLIATVDTYDTEAVRSLLHQGANPNALLPNTFYNRILNSLSPARLMKYGLTATIVGTIFTITNSCFKISSPLGAPLYFIGHTTSIVGLFIDLIGRDGYGPTSPINQRKYFLKDHTPLMIMANRSPLNQWGNHDNCIKIAKILLDHKANVHAQSSDNNNALSYAITNKNADLTKLLVLAGATIQTNSLDKTFENIHIKTSINSAHEMRQVVIKNTKALFNPQNYLSKQIPVHDIIKLIVAYDFPHENDTLDYNDPDIIWLLDYLKHTDPDFSMTH